MVFKSRNEDITEEQVKSFVLNKINELGATTKLKIKPTGEKH